MNVKTTHLEMWQPPQREFFPPREGILILQARQPTIAYYRFLFDTVGGPWHWTSRKKLTDDALRAIIHDPRDEIYVLHVEGVPAGFVELDRRVEGEIEITFFGLMAEFIGQGLGRFFLDWAVAQAWKYQPRRLWVHTCTRDHPGALPNYLRAGFAVFREEVKDEE